MNDMHLRMAHDQSRNRRVNADNASAWLVRRHEGLTAAEEIHFREWLDADPRHVVAFSEVERTWRELNQPRATGLARMAMERLAQRQKRRSRRRKIYALGIAGLAMLAFQQFRLQPAHAPSPPAASSPKIVVAPNRQILPDGSMIDLNAGADVTVEFSPARRAVRVMNGEALFIVAKDLARPFVVTAGNVEVRAVGTEFSVRYNPAIVDVLVTKGRVAVDRVVDSNVVPPANVPPCEPVMLDFGRRVLVPTALPPTVPLQVNVVTAADIEHALGWREKRIEFSATPLADVLVLFNRQNELQLVTDDAATAQLQISGIFWTNDPQGFVRLIKTGLHLTAQESGNTVVLRRERDAGGSH